MARQQFVLCLEHRKHAIW